MRTKITKEKAIELLEDAELVKTSSWKHGYTEHYVFNYDNDYCNNKYMVKVPVHHTKGWQLENEVEIFQVYPREILITEWVEI